MTSAGPGPKSSGVPRGSQGRKCLGAPLLGGSAISAPFLCLFVPPPCQLPPPEGILKARESARSLLFCGLLDAGENLEVRIFSLQKAGKTQSPFQPPEHLWGFSWHGGGLHFMNTPGGTPGGVPLGVRVARNAISKIS